MLGESEIQVDMNDTGNLDFKKIDMKVHYEDSVESADMQSRINIS